MLKDRIIDFLKIPFFWNTLYFCKYGLAKEVMQISFKTQSGEEGNGDICKSVNNKKTLKNNTQSRVNVPFLLGNQ